MGGDMKPLAERTKPAKKAILRMGVCISGDFVRRKWALINSTMDALVNLAGSLVPAGLLSMPESNELRVPVAEGTGQGNDPRAVEILSSNLEIDVF
jgi:hypothetical protein